MTSVGGHPRPAELEATLTAHLDQARARRCASKEHAIAVQTLCALGRHGEAAALLDRLAAMPAGTAEDDEALGFAAFAAGAVAAATWICGRKGVFPMDDVARCVLDPLFTGLGGGNA